MYSGDYLVSLPSGKAVAGRSAGKFVDYGKNANLQRRVLREIVLLQAMAKDEAPRVMRCLAAFKCEGRDKYCIVLEHAERSLDDLLQDRVEYDKYSDGQVLNLAEQFFGIMAYMRRRNITHRDVKPGNLLLLRGGGEAVATTLKVADFGLSGIVQDASRLQEVRFVFAPCALPSCQVEPLLVL